MKQMSNKISKKLSLARAYEKTHFTEIQRQERPGFHLSPALGWLNDPNGFSFYKEEYHLFYQYNPYSTRWDAMHWGHWTSKDLLHWDYQEASLAPDEDYETGVFSGTAIADKDGSHLIMYTADYTKAPNLFYGFIRKKWGSKRNPVYRQGGWERVSKVPGKSGAFRKGLAGRIHD